MFASLSGYATAVALAVAEGGRSHNVMKLNPADPITIEHAARSSAWSVRALDADGTVIYDDVGFGTTRYGATSKLDAAPGAAAGAGEKSGLVRARMVRMSDDEADRLERAKQRRSWPLAKFALGHEPTEDLSATTTPEERLGMMWQLAVEAWAVAGCPRCVWNATRHGASHAAGLLLARHGLPIGVPPRRIDTLTEISGVDFDDSWASRVEVPLDGRAIAFIGRDALVRNKRPTGRAKDIAEVERLEGHADPGDGG